MPAGGLVASSVTATSVGRLTADARWGSCDVVATATSGGRWTAVARWGSCDVVATATSGGRWTAVARWGSCDVVATARVGEAVMADVTISYCVVELLAELLGNLLLGLLVERVAQKLTVHRIARDGASNCSTA